ncbi:MAG: SCO family protein [Bacteroidetes bacterium]|nr:SCO family protein [Bacteroidota bacterium]
MKNSVNRLLALALSGVALASVSCTVPQSAMAADASHPNVGIVQHLGQTIPMNLTFKDENGKPVTLAQISDGKPLIIDMAYYTCPGICDQVFGGLQEVLEKVKETPGKDFNVATISFDPNDTPARALEKKEQYWGMINRPFPPKAWRFLTGDSVTIHKLTDALGFYYIRNKTNMFTHPTALIFVSKNGKIARYMYGTTFEAIDFQMAILEAKQNAFAPIIGQVLKTCFSYNAAGTGYSFDAIQVVGWGTTVFIIAILIFLWWTKKLKRVNANGGGN